MPTTLRRGLLIASICLIGALAAGLDQPSKAPAPAAVAVVDLAKLSKNLDEAKNLSEALARQRDEAQKKIEEIKTELTNVNKDLDGLKEKKGTPEYFRLLAKKFELEATLKARGEGLQQLIDIAEGDNMKIMFTRVVEAVTRIGKERGYDFILWDDRAIVPPTNPATGAQVWNIIRDRRILFASERVDITEQVLTQMNNEYKAAKK